MSSNTKVTKYIRHVIGGDTLHKGYYFFLLVHTSFLVAVKLPGVFINTLLLGESNDIDVVLMYNLFFFLTGAISMLLAAPVLHRTSPGFVAVLGIAGYNVLYLILIVLLLSKGSVSEYHLLLATLLGLSDGFYWLAYGNLLSDTTEAKNRDSGVAIIGISMSIVNLTAPLLAGFIITRGGHQRGYLIVFALAFLVSIITAVLAIKLPKGQTANTQKVEYIQSLQLLWRNKRLRYAMLAQGNKGIREGVFSFILSIVLYQMISNELVIGVNSFVAALVSVCSFVLMSRLLNQRNRVRYMTLAVSVLSAAAAVCLFHLTIGMIFVFTVLNSLFSGFIENSSYSNFIDRLQETSELDKHRPEMFAINECVLVLGRSVGIAIILLVGAFFGNSLPVQMVSLLVLSVTQFLTAVFCSKSNKTDKNK